MPGGEAADPEAWDPLRARLHRMRWNVYAKRPFGGAEQGIRYLGRYTHRVGISNHRLVTMDERGITFRTKDGKTVTLSPDAFLGRFRKPVLPDGFVKIRHFGLMAASHATTRLEVARALLVDRACPAAAPPQQVTEDDAALVDAVGSAAELGRCPVCGATAVVPQPLPELHARAPPEAP